MTMENSDQLEKFVADFAAAHGGVAERTEAGSALRVLLPVEVAEAVGLPEDAVLGAEAIPLAYGSPVLDRMVQQATHSCPVTYAQIQPPYLKKAGFEQILSRDLAFPNGKVQIRGTAASRATYMVLTAHYAAWSDERKEGLLQLAVQEKTGAQVAGLLDGWMQHRPIFFDPGNIPSHFPRNLERTLQRALAAARVDAEETLREFVESMRRRLRRDIRNTREYYAALEKEMTDGLAHPTLGEAQREERKAKIAELPAEARRKIEDLQQKYQIRLHLRPAGAVRILLDVVHVMVNLQHRKLQRDLNLFWNPVSQAVDPLVCEACGNTITSVYCSPAEGGIRHLCFACHSRTS